MRTVTFQSVFEAVLRRHGFDPFGDAVTHDTAKAVAMRITERAGTAWMMWRWSDLTKTEERAYRQVWNEAVQYRLVGEDGLPDELYYMPTQKYYQVKLADPAPGTIPTDTTYFSLLQPVTTFVARDQAYKLPLGQVIGVYPSNPSLNGCCAQGCLDFTPSEKGIKICCGPPTTVFIQHLLGEPEYTMTPWIDGKAYVKGDIVFYFVTGDCYRCIADNTSNVPTDTAFWVLVPVPAMFSTYMKEGAYADGLKETISSSSSDSTGYGAAAEMQARAARVTAAETLADQSIEGLIDDLLEQGQKFHYVHPQGARRTWTYDGTLWWSQQCGRLCHSEPWSGDIVFPLTDSLEMSVAPPLAPLTIPIANQRGSTQLVVGQSYVDIVFHSSQTNTNWILVGCEIVNTTDLTPLNISPGIITSRTLSGFRIQLEGVPETGNYFLQWAINGTVMPAVPATTYSLTGPTSGLIGAAAMFTAELLPDTTITAPLLITPHDGGGGGVFSPTSILLTSEAPSGAFTYTPGLYGSKTISATNDGGLTNPTPIIFTSLASTYTFTGPSSGNNGVASTNFTVALPAGGVVLATVTVTPNSGGGGGTFTPTSVALTTGAPSATFTYTPASSGAKTISVTNNGGLTNPGNLTYTSVGLALLNTLISYWKMDETQPGGVDVPRVDSKGTNNLDDPTHNLNFGGIIGQAVYAPLLTCANNATLQVTGDFTFSVWLRMDSTTADQSILQKGDVATPPSDYWFRYYGTTGPSGFQFGNGTIFATVGSDVATAFTWHHVVAWFDSSNGSFHMRIDDANSYASATGVSLVQTTNPLLSGYITYSGALNSSIAFLGLVDEVGFWKRKLTAGEITALYNGGAGLPFSSFTT